MGEHFNREQPFPNIQYSTIISIVMRSFETLIENHVGSNFKEITLRYLSPRLCDSNEFPDLPFSTGVKRGLAERVYNAICNNQEVPYPDTLEVADIYKTLINNLNRTTNSYSRATKGFVHRQLEEIVNFRKLPRQFHSTLENHVRDSINMDQPTIQRYSTHSFLENIRRRSREADPNQGQRHNDLLAQEKADIDGFVAMTRTSIARSEFRPEQFTDPHGARLFNLLPIFSLQRRYI
ncbi:hypothetical protein BDB01DRAFT_895272 [Pilobolus umbonatus]|nr:hypothetical protein BDB01DRAFT_895272 [Pilobolus umbonatus]